MGQFCLIFLHSADFSDTVAEKDLKEGEAEVSVVHRKHAQTAALTEVFTTYFRWAIFESCLLDERCSVCVAQRAQADEAGARAASRAQGPGSLRAPDQLGAGAGPPRAAQAAHLARHNVSASEPLAWRTVLPIRPPLSVESALNCVLAAFVVLKGHGATLTIDLKDVRSNRLVQDF